MAKAKVSSKGTPKQEDFLDGFEVHMEEMSKMKYVDFRKAAAGLFATIHNAMIENIKWYAKDRDGYIDVITKKFKEIDEILEIARGRIENLEHQLYAVAVIVKKLDGTPFCDESQKKFASGLNIDLDGWRAMVEREAIESPETAT
ncbi:MAG: hypothetical protein JRF60_18885 [Deltaproteobacteria bacterium]|nr:hypothetical protein [Deltaproteobacteria bacterium]MBW2572916.1 hypothetical protein [Deltaproteobacteria bacterium]